MTAPKPKRKYVRKPVEKPVEVPEQPVSVLVDNPDLARIEPVK